MPKRSRRRMVGKWEQIERKAREDELKELERELRQDWEGDTGTRPRRKRKRVQDVEAPRPKPSKHNADEEPPVQP